MCAANSQLSWSSMTHRYRGGHRFKSRWSLNIFQASFFQLLKLENLLRWSLFTFFFVSFVLHHLWVWQIFTLRMSHRVCMEKKCYKTQSCRSIKSYYKFGMQTSNSVNIILLITEKSAVSCNFIPQQSLILEALINSFSWLLYQLFRWSVTPFYSFKLFTMKSVPSKELVEQLIFENFVISETRRPPWLDTDPNPSDLEQARKALLYEHNPNLPQSPDQMRAKRLGLSTRPSHKRSHTAPGKLIMSKVSSVKKKIQALNSS